MIYGTRKWGGYETWHSTSSDKKTLTKDVVLCEGPIDSAISVKANNIGMGYDKTTIEKPSFYVSGISNFHFIIHDYKYSGGAYALDVLNTDGYVVFGVVIQSSTSITSVFQSMESGIKHSYPQATVSYTGSDAPFMSHVGYGTYYTPFSLSFTYTRHEGGSIPGCSYAFHNGSPTQDPPSNYDTVGGYKNCAWIRAELKSSDQLQGSNPTMTCVIKGLLVNDTRASTTAYSENPAMCLRDYLLNKRYGLGRWLTSDMIDEDSFKECADYCDEVIAYYVPNSLSTYDAVQNKITALQQELDANPGYSQETRDNIQDSIDSLKISLLSISTQPVSQELVTSPRYTLNIILADKQSHIDDIQQILAAFGGFLVFNGNKISLRMEKGTSVSYAFTDDTICSTKEGRVDIKWETTSLADAPNQYIMKFYDPKNEYVGVKVQVNDFGNQRERGKVITKEITLDGITSQSQALRLGRMYLAKTKMCYGVCTFSTGTYAMHLQPGDVITITHGILLNQPMRILQTSEENGKWTIKCQQWNSSIYSDYLDQAITYKNYTTVSNAFTDVVPDVTGVTFDQNYYIQHDGSSVSTITGTCAIPSYSFYSSCDIYVSTGGDYGYLMNTATGEFTMQGAIVGQTYTFKILVVNSAGRKSSGFVSQQVICTGKDNPPSDVSDFVVAQFNHQFVLQGSIPTDADFSHCEVRYDGTSWDTSVFLATDITSFPCYISNAGITDGSHVFRVKAVDNGGNYSVNDKEYVCTVRNINTFKNVILSRNDITDGLGTLENIVQLPNEKLVNLAGITYGDVSGYDYTKYPSTYGSATDTSCSYTSNVVDMGKLGWVNVNFCFKFEALANPDAIVYGALSGRTYGDYPKDTYGNISLPYDVTISVRFSNDNTTWTNWQTYVSGEYYYRYIQYKVVSNYISGSRFYVDSLQQYYDVHDVTIAKTISVPIGGTTVTYDDPFYSVPSDITMTVTSPNGGVYPRYTSSTKGSITITCYDTTGTSVAATVDLVVHGY